MRGVVKFFDPIQDYGFIRRPGFDDVFFTGANVERSGRIDRFDGVAYDLVEMDAGRPRAQRVRKIELE